MNKNNVIRPDHFSRRPWWFNGLNKLWKGLYPLGVDVKIDKDVLIKKSRDKTGLTDLGKDFWDEPLERLIASINEEANLHPVGRFINYTRFINLISNRLRAEEMFKKHPGILDQPLYPIFVITGLQRTGTTKLQRLLNADPNNRVLASWEAINPVPVNTNWEKSDKRIKEARTSEKALKLMAPGFFAIHPVEYQAPEEDILLLDMSFLSTTPEATMHVPSYSQWLENTDQSLAYSYAAKLLKLLQWQKPAKRWVLKSPHHLEFPDMISKYYKDVKFLWTHRNPNESIPSFLSMVSHSRAIFSNKVTLKDVSDHWVRKSGYMLQKAIEFREKENYDKLFIDIQYEEFIENPIKVLAGIYKLNGSMTEEQQKQFEVADKQNPQGKYGIHQYSLQDFGLSESIIESHVKVYYDYFANQNGKQ